MIHFGPVGVFIKNDSNRIGTSESVDCWLIIGTDNLVQRVVDEFNLHFLVVDVFH